MTADRPIRIGRLRAAVLVPGAVLATSTLATGATTVAGAATSLSQRVGAIVSAAKHAGSVRISVQFFSGKTTGQSLQDSTLNAGQITVAIGAQRASIVLSKGVGYLFANSAAITGYLGFPQTLTSALANKWISVQPTDVGYASYVANVSLTSALATITPRGELIAGKKTKVNGKAVYSIGGLGPGGQGRTELFYAAKGRPLPVEVVQTSGSGSNVAGEIISFSRWGEKVTLAKPTSPIPLAAIQGAIQGS
jgi:hypothetical protein